MCPGDNSGLPESICHLRLFSFLREIRWPRENEKKYKNILLILFCFQSTLKWVRFRGSKWKPTTPERRLNWTILIKTPHKIIFLRSLPFFSDPIILWESVQKEGGQFNPDKGNQDQIKTLSIDAEIQDLSHLSSILLFFVFFSVPHVVNEIISRLQIISRS